MPESYRDQVREHTNYYFVVVSIGDCRRLNLLD